MQKSFYFKEKVDKDKSLEDLFSAYFDARKNKRNTINALIFERNFESNLFSLFEEIIERRYKPKPSICFIVNNPVKREIFAADFRDRVIHHFIYNYLYPIFEKILVNDTYSCRKKKGISYGIKRIDHFIRSCSENYKKDCYILKLDIRSYFTSIRKDLLYSKIKKDIGQKKVNFDLPLIFYLLEETIFNNPVNNCIIKGNKKDWQDLVKTKSLFYTKPNCGLPIGNLTSQLFGNVYLNNFDYFIKEELKIKYYGRYVDDFVIIDRNKNKLRDLIPKIKEYLKNEEKLELHPKKIYLQHFSKGVKYLGVVIKPYRMYISNQTKGNFCKKLKESKINNKSLLKEEIRFKFLSMVNSYLGTLSHYSTYRIRKKILSRFLPETKGFSIEEDFLKIK